MALVPVKTIREVTEGTYLVDGKRVWECVAVKRNGYGAPLSCKCVDVSNDIPDRPLVFEPERADEEEHWFKEKRLKEMQRVVRSGVVAA